MAQDLKAYCIVRLEHCALSIKMMVSSEKYIIHLGSKSLMHRFKLDLALKLARRTLRDSKKFNEQKERSKEL